MKSTIVLLGPPGSGKGTQGEKLSDELGYIRLSTGDMLREAVRNQTELGKKAKEFMDAGALVPNDLIIGLMKEKIAQAEGGVILDGFPGPSSRQMHSQSSSMSIWHSTSTSMTRSSSPDSPRGAPAPSATQSTTSSPNPP